MPVRLPVSHRSLLTAPPVPSRGRNTIQRNALLCRASSAVRFGRKRRQIRLSPHTINWSFAQRPSLKRPRSDGIPCLLQMLVTHERILWRIQLQSWREDHSRTEIAGEWIDQPAFQHSTPSMRLQLSVSLGTNLGKEYRLDTGSHLELSCI